MITMNKNRILNPTFLWVLDGCFTDSTRAVNLSTYTPDLIKRINWVSPWVPPNIGYLFTDPTRAWKNKTFQKNLAGNIKKYITSRYCPSPIPGQWNAHPNSAARIQSLNWACQPLAKPNPNGYFYYKSDNTSTSIMTISGLSDVNSGVNAAKDDEIRQPTVLYVVGGDVYIKENIKYSTLSGDTPSLVIIVQKNSGGTWGNIYVDPSVTYIDATLIADGALMNAAISGNTLGIHNWISHPETLWNRLVINGRLLTHNTRGGSLTSTLQPVTTINQSGICATDTSSSCTWNMAAAQDLERFRRVETGSWNEQCSLYVTDNMPARRPDILTTVLEGY